MLLTVDSPGNVTGFALLMRNVRPVDISENAVGDIELDACDDGRCTAGMHDVDGDREEATTANT